MSLSFNAETVGFSSTTSFGRAPRASFAMQKLSTGAFATLMVRAMCCESIRYECASEPNKPMQATCENARA